MPTAPEPMLKDGAVVYTTDRNVPGTHIRLEFTLRFENKKYLALVNAVRNGQTLLRQRYFDHMYPEPIHTWAGTLVEAINKKFNTSFVGVLNNELTHLMDNPQAIPVVSAPTVPPTVEVVVTPAAQDLFSYKDIWETNPAALITQPIVVSTLTLRRLPKGIGCLLHVEREGKECPLPTAFNSIDQVYTWLGDYDTAKLVANKLAMDDGEALGLCKRWLAQFAQPLQDWHNRFTGALPSWLNGKQPPPQTYLVDGKTARLP